MIVTGTFATPDDEYKRVEVEAPSYEEARDQLMAQIPEGQMLIAIRTDRPVQRGYSG